LAPVSINDLMAAIGQTPVELPDPNAAGRLQADFSFETDLSTVTLGDLDVSLDDYTIASPRITLGLESQNLKIDSINIAAGDIRVDASVAGQKVIDAPQLSGTFTLHPVSIDALFDLAGQTPVETTDPDVLKQLSVTSEYQTNLKSLLLKKLEVTLDDSQLKGRIEIKDFETAVTRFNLRIDDIDLDRYLPPTDESGSAAESGSESGADSLDALAGLDVKGTIKIRDAKAMGLKFKNLTFGLLAKNGHIQIHPSEAKMYGGSYSGDVRLNANPRPAIASVNEKVTGVDISALAADLFEGGMPVSGTAEAAFQVQLPYGVDGALAGQANGKIDLAIRNGVYSGVDIWHTLKSGVARVRNEAVPAAPQNPQTSFSEFVASGPIENGRWNTEELRVRLDYGTVSGSGYIDLNDNTLDYQIDVVIDDTPEIREDPQLRKLVRASIPIRVTGTIDSPRAVPDVGELLKRQAEQAAQDKIEKESDKLKEKLEDKLKNLFDR
jgi:AsmA protein